MCLQVGTGLVKLVVEIQIEVEGLQIYDEKHGRNHSGKLTEGFVQVAGLVLPPQAGTTSIFSSSVTGISLWDDLWANTPSRITCETGPPLYPAHEKNVFDVFVIFYYSGFSTHKDN
jgi:hypothetical protein